MHIWLGYLVVLHWGYNRDIYLFIYHGGITGSWRYNGNIMGYIYMYRTNLMWFLCVSEIGAPTRNTNKSAIEYEKRSDNALELGVPMFKQTHLACWNWCWNGSCPFIGQMLKWGNDLEDIDSYAHNLAQDQFHGHLRKFSTSPLCAWLFLPS